MLKLEAPGDFLSELLAVTSAGSLAISCGGVRELPPDGDWRLLAPSRGRLRLAWEDQWLELAEGRAAAFPGTVELSLLALEDCRVELICLRGEAAERIFLDCQRQGGLCFQQGGAALGRMLSLLGSASGPIQSREASAEAYRLLLTLHGPGAPTPAGQHRLPLVVEAALGLIRQDFAFLDGVAELAERLEVSQEYLTRCFRQYMGVTPGRYLNQVRIENAKLLLAQGGHSVGFVSEACGFSNGNYFARVFRKSTGMNPRDYARLGRQATARAHRDDSIYLL